MGRAISWGFGLRAVKRGKEQSCLALRAHAQELAWVGVWEGSMLGPVPPSLPRPPTSQSRKKAGMIKEEGCCGQRILGFLSECGN